MLHKSVTFPLPTGALDVGDVVGVAVGDAVGVTPPFFFPPPPLAPPPFPPPPFQPPLAPGVAATPVL